MSKRRILKLYLVGTSRCDVPARIAGGTCAVQRPTTLVAPLYAARTAQRAVPTITRSRTLYRKSWWVTALFASGAATAVTARSTGARESGKFVVGCPNAHVPPGIRAGTAQRAVPTIARNAVLLGALLLSGCQTYHSRPLPTTPDLLQAPAITVPANQFNLSGLEPHPFPTNGLDETAVVTLAVYNSPDLKAARLQAGVADAQLVDVGLLPDPQVGAGIAKSPSFIGYNVNLSEDIQALITRGAAKASAKAHAHQVNLDILWQEYQVAAKAEQLFIQLRADDELQMILTSSRNLLSDRYREDEASLRQGNVSADTASADLAALMDAERNLGQNELDSNQTRHDLNQLLGLQPDVRLHLVGRHKTQSISPGQFHSAVAAIARRRADLLALQAGYQSQEESLREAVLAQFPSMSAGVEPARDPVEGVNTIGLNVNLTLPLFNRNQGQIAIQRATRAQLYQTYQARLDQSVNDASRVWSATQIMARQLRDIEISLPALEKKMTAAARQFQQGNLDAGTYTTMKLNLATEQAEAIRLRASQEQAKADLQILLGLPLMPGAPWVP